MKFLLDVSHLKTWFPIRRGILARTAGFVRAVDGVSLQIQAGETVALVGESGCGKTTLARSLLRLDPVLSGEIYFEGQNILALTERRLREVRRRLQIVFQDPFAALNPRMSVADIVTEGLLEHGLIAAREKFDAARRLLSEVGLAPEAAERYPHEFSGGQRQRISIARALALRPRLLVCDEPVSALDVSVQAQILNLLVDLRERHGLAYLFISHDLRVVRHLAHRTAVMYLGRIVEEGTTSAVLERPRHPYTRALLSAVPRPGPKRERIVLSGEVPSPVSPPAGCRFRTRCPFATPACAEIEPALEVASGSDGVIPHRVACLRHREI